ncbi:MAG TPA: carbonic anhydrase [Jatrophihabitans sp.]|nr:carbonic anhydrase [Jatrophihabitans sp.]
MSKNQRKRGHAKPMPGGQSGQEPVGLDTNAAPLAGVFADVLEANAAFSVQDGFDELTGRAARGLAVLTCMDSRIIPLAMLGLEPGDAKVLRNAGARVTDDVLRTLVLATYLLDVNRVMVIAHTDCRMADCVETDVHNAIHDAGGPDTRSISFLTTDDQRQTLLDDVQRIRSWPYLGNVNVGGFLCDTPHAKLTQVC